jgi:hypothetical protein
VNLIFLNIIEEGGMELSNDLGVPVISEAHQILDVPFFNQLQDLLCLWSASPMSLKVMPVYPLHTNDLVFA